MTSKPGVIQRSFTSDRHVNEYFFRTVRWLESHYGRCAPDVEELYGYTHYRTNYAADADRAKYVEHLKDAVIPKHYTLRRTCLHWNDDWVIVVQVARNSNTDENYFTLTAIVEDELLGVQLALSI